MKTEALLADACCCFFNHSVLQPFLLQHSPPFNAHKKIRTLTIDVCCCCPAAAMSTNSMLSLLSPLPFSLSSICPRGPNALLLLMLSPSTIIPERELEWLPPPPPCFAARPLITPMLLLLLPLLLLVSLFKRRSSRAASAGIAVAVAIDIDMDIEVRESSTSFDLFRRQRRTVRPLFFSLSLFYITFSKTNRYFYPSDTRKQTSAMPVLRFRTALRDKQTNLPTLTYRPHKKIMLLNVPCSIFSHENQPTLSIDLFPL